MKLRNLIFILFMSVLFLFTVVPAQAVTFGFYNITGNNADDAAIGEAQLFVDVTDPSGEENLLATQALFTFRNIGPDDSSICDVYFDDGTLLGIASIDNSSLGVSFSQDADPGNLPGGNTVSPVFETSTEPFFAMPLSADSDPRVQPNGVNPEEYLGILFDLQSDGTFADVLTELQDATLRIGIHVQGFALIEGEEEEGSESFINTDEEGFIPPHSVPEPATMVLLASGILRIAVSGKKRLKKRNG